MNAEKECILFILYIRIGLPLSRTDGESNGCERRMKWNSERGSETVECFIGGIRYERVP